jgi:CspA family cold shock protein
MTHYGKIKSYDPGKGTGTIAPEKGGDALAFVKADLQQESQEPKVDQRFGYETKQVDGGKAHAVNLQMEQGSRESADAQQS